MKPFTDFSKGSDPNGLASYCIPCRKEYYRNRTPNRKRQVSGPLRSCCLCSTEFPKEYFKRAVGKYESYCRPCKSRLSYLRNIKRFNITEAQYDALMDNQNGVCAICYQVDNRRLGIDHDHSCCPGNYSCGKCVRGLLCGKCNRTLGNYNDDLEVFKRMAGYLS